MEIRNYADDNAKVKVEDNITYINLDAEEVRKLAFFIRQEMYELDLVKNINRIHNFILFNLEIKEPVVLIPTNIGSKQYLSVHKLI